MGRKRIYAGVLTIMCALAMCGCGPKEDEDVLSILVKEDEARAYEMTEAKKEKIQKTKVIVANYQQVKSEDLSFKVDGRRLAGVYVSKGDTVKKGDLLLELYCDEEKEYLAELEYQIMMLETDIVYLREKKELELLQLDRKKSSMTEQEYREKADALETACRLETEDIEDQIYIARLRYDELYQWIEGCKVYAGMDGTVTYLTDTGSGFISWGGSRVVTVSDSTKCAFLSDAIEYASYFTVGNSYVFATSTGVEYETTLVEIDESEGVLRFELTDSQYDMPLGQRVLYSLVLEEKENALSVPKNAVHYVGENAYVYYFDENGNRRMKQVEIGLQADSKVEVCSGLAEGEEVILR